LHEENVAFRLKDLDGILVAPGFGSRGIDGKILAIQYARENDIPFFGICLGMQCAVIEFARNVLGLKDAHTTEIDQATTNPVIDIMADQKAQTNKGGTMRLGAYACDLIADSKTASAYNSQHISERHRHRYEFNNAYLKAIEEKGMIAVGKNPESGLVEVVEIPELTWFVATQFHPEYKSTVERPHPLFVAFVKAAVRKKKGTLV
jgi:CTP synthase